MSALQYPVVGSQSAWPVHSADGTVGRAVGPAVALPDHAVGADGAVVDMVGAAVTGARVVAESGTVGAVGTLEAVGATVAPVPVVGTAAVGIAVHTGGQTLSMASLRPVQKPH